MILLSYLLSIKERYKFSQNHTFSIYLTEKSNVVHRMISITVLVGALFFNIADIVSNANAEGELFFKLL